MSDPRRRSYSSRARTHATSAFVLVPFESVRVELASLGLEVERAAAVPEGTHPVWLDLGYIERGAAEAGGVDQHTWWQWAGEAAGGAAWWAAGAAMGGAASAGSGAVALAMLGSWLGPAGFWSGAAAGWLGGAGLGAVAGGIAGAAYGRALGARSGRSLSATTSQALGCYREAIVAVPNVVGKRDGTRYLYVLAMHTDGPVAVWGDGMLRYGYRKRLGTLSGRKFELYEVRDGRGERLLRAETRRPAAAAWRRPRQMAGIAGALDWISQPLLGHLGGDRFAVSVLERRYFGAGVQVAPAVGRLWTREPLAPLIGEGQHELLPLGPRRPWGAFTVHNVEACVTYPEHRRRSEL
jgi:hypothetical protein